MNIAWYGRMGSLVLFWIAVLLLGMYSLGVASHRLFRNTLVVAAWGDMFDESVIREFEQETGISVTLSYFSSNEELLVKLAKTRGKGIDLIVPSDYALAQMIELGILAPLDHARLPFYQDIIPALRELPCDPGNRYAIPFGWEVYVLGFNKTRIDPAVIKQADWSALFNGNYSVAMVNDPLELVQFGGWYLYHHAGPYNKDQFAGITKLLIDQKKQVRAYSDGRADYFLITADVEVMLGSGSQVIRAQKFIPAIAWHIPEDGCFVSVEHCALLKESDRSDQAYAFLRFLYTKQRVLQHVRTKSFLPPFAVMQDEPDLSGIEALFRQAIALRDHWVFFSSVNKRDEIQHVWAQVKSI